MKTIASKEFQLRQSTILKEVARGERYQITFHRKPFVILSPADNRVGQAATTQPVPGSKQAFLESLKYTLASSGDLKHSTYKDLRKQMMTEKYGE